jgi:hypothetical protein
MSARILVPSDGSHRAAQVIYEAVADFGSDAEIIVGHVKVPGVPVEEQTAMTSGLISQVMAAFSRSVLCRVATIDASSVPVGISLLAKREAVDAIAMYTDDSRPAEERPNGPFAREVGEISDEPVRVIPASSLDTA